MQGYRLSKALYELKTAAKIAELVADPPAARERYGLSDEEIDALRSGDWGRLCDLGANPYLIRFAYRDQKTFDVQPVKR